MAGPALFAVLEGAVLLAAPQAASRFAAPEAEPRFAAPEAALPIAEALTVVVLTAAPITAVVLRCRSTHLCRHGRGLPGPQLSPFAPFCVRVNTIEIYSRQARDFENEMRAIEIRIRAERRCGELLAEMDRAQGKRSDLGTSGQADAKSFSEQREAYGISQTQSSRWQKLAAVQEAEFEATFARPEKPSTTGIINRGSEKKRDVVDPRALGLWGRLLDFERDGLLGADPEEICATIFCDSGYRKPRRRQISPASEPRATRLSGPLLRAIDWKCRKRTRDGRGEPGW